MTGPAGPTVASDIEEFYAEIGRSVVDIAIERAKEVGLPSSGQVETTVAIRLVFEPDTATGVAVMCCICTCDTDEVWTCAGPCCLAGSGR